MLSRDFREVMRDAGVFWVCGVLLPGDLEDGSLSVEVFQAKSGCFLVTRLPSGRRMDNGVFFFDSGSDVVA
jgi:hypothetical protein